MSWTVDVVLEFVELYKREPILWDPRHVHHRNRAEITEAWLRIQSSLSISCSVDDLKKKKESLMTSFRMHFNRKRKSPNEYRTTWFAYQLMESFLGEKYDCDSTNSLEQEFFNSASYITEAAVPDHQYSGRNVNTTGRSSSMGKQSRACLSQLNTAEVKKSDLQYAKRQMDEAIEAVTYLKTEAREQKEMDECDLYAQLLAKKLRKLDEHQRDVAMHDIDNIMFRAKMESVPSQQKLRSYSSSPSPVPRKIKSPIFIVTQQHSQYEDEDITYQQDPMQEHPPS